MISVNTVTHEYDPHYLIGNYYQFNTATAGYGGVYKNESGEWVGVQNTNVEYSICPKGWKLPLSGNNTEIEALNNNGKSGSFYYMLEKYGLQSSVSAGQYNIAQNPLYFVRSGGIDLNYNFLRVFGRHGSNWSTTTSNYQINYIATAYRLSFTPVDFNPSDNFNRAHGFPVRCLVILC